MRKYFISVVCHLDINDKYLIYGSLDGSCIIWELPHFKPIDRLILPHSNFLIGVNLYNDQYLFVSDDHKVTVLDLQTNEINFLSTEAEDKGPVPGFKVNNKIITVNPDSTVWMI